MKTNQFLINFLMGVCFVQVIICQTTEPSELEEYIDKALKAVQNAISTVENDVNTAENILNNVEHEISQAEGKLLGNENPEVTAIINKQRKILLTRSTGNINSACLSTAEDGLGQLPSQLDANLKDCVTTEVTTAQNIISDTNRTISNIVAAVSSLPDQLEACKSSLSPYSCAGSVITKADQAGSSAASTIAQDVAKASAFGSGLETRLKTCAATQAANAEAAAGQIVATFIKCITGSSD